ncbi:MAG: hypothetical protein KDA89_14885 [Planctomycetaceae bacterium]|nr:hypothetical protein [Planctomycetaceae bacterium]
MCLMFGGAFFGLLAVIIPGAGAIGLVILGLGLMFAAQYFIWGRWLYGLAVRLEQRSSGETAPSADQSANRQNV